MKRQHYGLTLVVLAVAGLSFALLQTMVAPAQLAGAIHPVFVIGSVVMTVTLALVLFIPELPLRRTVREVPA